MNPQIIAWFLGSVIVGIEELRDQDTTLYRVTVIVDAFLYPPFIVQLLIVIDFFFWQENLSFFLEACQILGLKGSQLFCPEDLQASASSPVRKSRT